MQTIPQVYIVDGLRSPIGKKNGALAQLHPADLAAIVVDALLKRNGLAADQIDEMFLGCMTQSGAQAFNLARVASLAAGLPPEVSALTVDGLLASGLRAILLGVQSIASRQADIVLCGGLESASMSPWPAQHPTNAAYASEKIWEHGWDLRLPGLAVEKGAEKHGLTREDLDGYALRSRLRYRENYQNSGLRQEIAAINTTLADGTAINLMEDECTQAKRFTTSEPEMHAAYADQAPVFHPRGKLHAGHCSHASDGTAIVLLASETAFRKLSPASGARVVAYANIGDTPGNHGTAAVRAVQKAWTIAGLRSDAISQRWKLECSETFASEPLIASQQLAIPLDNINAWGGSLATGLPLGASGAMQCLRMLSRLTTTDASGGICAVNAGFGMGSALILEQA